MFWRKIKIKECNFNLSPEHVEPIKIQTLETLHSLFLGDFDLSPEHVEPTKIQTLEKLHSLILGDFDLSPQHVEPNLRKIMQT